MHCLQIKYKSEVVLTDSHTFLDVFSHWMETTFPWWLFKQIMSQSRESHVWSGYLCWSLLTNFSLPASQVRTWKNRIRSSVFLCTVAIKETRVENQNRDQFYLLDLKRKKTKKNTTRTQDSPRTHCFTTICNLLYAFFHLNRSNIRRTMRRQKQRPITTFSLLQRTPFSDSWDTQAPSWVMYVNPDLNL